MKIEPAAGTVFVVEDEEDFSSYKKIGLDMPTDAKKGVGSTGVVYKVTHGQEGFLPRFRHWLFADMITQRWKVGDRVIFDKFVASDIYLRDENGEEIKRLKTTPIDCILGKITMDENVTSIDLK